MTGTGKDDETERQKSRTRTNDSVASTLRGEYTPWRGIKRMSWRRASTMSVTKTNVTTKTSATKTNHDECEEWAKRAEREWQWYNQMHDGTKEMVWLKSRGP